MSSNNVPTNLEILKMAREIVHNEYIDAKAQLHNKWLVDADLLWRSTRTRLVYPPFPPYPTEEVIVARAKVLRDFLANGKEEVNIEPAQPQQEEPVPVTVNIPQESTKETVEVVEEPPGPQYNYNVNNELHGEDLEKAVDDSVKEYTRTVVSNRIEEELNAPSRLIPSLMKRIDEIKRNWGGPNSGAT